MLILLAIGQQLVGNPQQAQPTDQHQAWDLQQPNHAHGHQGAHRNGANGAKQNGFLLQMFGKIFGGQCNDNGVVASQHEIDQDNGQKGRPPGGRKDFHGFTPDNSNLSLRTAHGPSDAVNQRERPQCLDPSAKTTFEGLAQLEILKCAPNRPEV